MIRWLFQSTLRAEFGGVSVAGFFYILAAPFADHSYTCLFTGCLFVALDFRPRRIIGQASAQSEGSQA